MPNCSKCNKCNKNSLKSRPLLVKKVIDFDDLNIYDNNKLNNLESKLLKLRGIDEVELNFENKEIRVYFDDIIISFEEILDIINEKFI